MTGKAPVTEENKTSRMEGPTFGQLVKYYREEVMKWSQGRLGKCLNPPRKRFFIMDLELDRKQAPGLSVTEICDIAYALNGSPPLFLAAYIRQYGRLELDDLSRSEEDLPGLCEMIAVAHLFPGIIGLFTHEWKYLDMLRIDRIKKDPGM